MASQGLSPKSQAHAVLVEFVVSGSLFFFFGISGYFPELQFLVVCPISSHFSISSPRHLLFIG